MSDENAGSVTPTITVGDQTYSQDELQSLVGLGRIAQEAETTYNTKIDRVWPQYTKQQQELKELRAQKEAWEVPKVVEKQPDMNAAEARQAARQLGIVTEDGISDFVGKEFPILYQQFRSAERLMDQATALESTYNGSDGRPAFHSQEMFDYMKETGIRTPEQAYKIKYESEIDAWKESHLSKAKKPGLVTNSAATAGGKLPAAIQVNKDNLMDLVQQGIRGEL